MSPYDIFMLIIFLGAVFFGFWKGLAWQVASLAAIFLSYFVALNFREPVSQFISAEPPINKFAAMLILFLGTSLVVWIIFGRVRATIKKMQLKSFDRQAGALLGAFKGGLLCMVVTMFAVTLLGSSVRQQIINSRSGGYIATGIDKLTAMVPPELHDVIYPHVQRYQEALANEQTQVVPPNENNGVAGGGLFGGGQVMPASTGTGANNGNGATTYPPNGPTGQPYTNYTQPTSPYQQPGNNTSPIYQNPNSQSGSFGQPPNNQGYQNYQGTFQNSPYQQSGYQQGSQQQGGYQQQQGNGPQSGTYPGGQQQYQPQQQYQQPQYQQPQGQQQPYGYRPPANQQQGGQPLISQGENGYPDLNFTINSKDLLNQGGELLKNGANQALDRLLETGQ